MHSLWKEAFMRRAIATLLVIIAVLAGIYYGRERFEEKRREAEKSKGGEAQAAALSRDGRPGSGESERPLPEAFAPERPVTERPAVEELEPPDPEPFRKALQEAKAFYRDARFAQARERVKWIPEKLKPFRDPGIGAIRGEADRLAKASHVLHSLTRNIRPNPFSDGNNLKLMKLKNRNDLVVRILKRGGEGISFRLANGIESMLPLDEVAEIRDLGLDEWRKRLQTELEDKLDRANPSSPLDLYRVAFFCMEYDLRVEAVPLLERALAQRHAEILIDTFCDGDLNRLKYEWFVSRGDKAGARRFALAAGIKVDHPSRSGGSGGGDPGPGPREREPRGEGSSGQEPLREEAHGEEPGPGESGGKKPGGDRPSSPPEGHRSEDLRSSPLFRKAQTYYRQGLRHYRRSLPGMPGAEKELKAAKKLFEEVKRLYVELQRQYPASSEIEERMVDLNVLLYDCIKRTGVQ
jgi:hypothetical protein